MSGDEEASPPIDVNLLRRPSVIRYRELVNALLAVDRQLVQGASPLQTAIEAVSAVSRFIGSDPALRLAGVSLSLRRLLAALDDTAAGAKPELLFDGGKRGGLSKRGRPTNQSADVLRGALVHSLSGLITAGMDRKQAARFLEQACAKRRARYRGKLITAANLLQWREQTGDTAPAGSDGAVWAIDQLRAQFGSELPLTIENAKRIAVGIASVVARYDSAPEHSN